MDELPESLLLEILSRLHNSADVARCRVAFKAFNAVFPDLRSINLQCPRKWCRNSSSRDWSSLRNVLMNLISKLRVVESVCMCFQAVDEDFANEWLPRVSESLKSLSLSGFCYCNERQSNVLPLISAYCHNLAKLKVTRTTCLSVSNLNPMPMLTSLTLALTKLEDQHLNQLNKCFPNLQVLKLVGVRGLQDPKIHHLKLQSCHLDLYINPLCLTLITPNLITLRIECTIPTAIHVEAPILSHFRFCLYTRKHAAGAFTAKKFGNLKTVLLDSSYLGSILSEFPITKTVEDLTLESRNKTRRNATVSELTLGKVFMIFPNVSSLRINLGAWLQLEACLNPEGWEILDGGIRLKTICAYLMLVDPSLTFSYVACVLDQCVGLSVVSFLIYCDVVGTIRESFMSKCMGRWPGLKWRWGRHERFLDN